MALTALCRQRLVAKYRVLFANELHILIANRSMTLIALNVEMLALEKILAIDIMIELRLLPRLLAMAFTAIGTELSGMVIGMAGHT